MRLIRKPVQIIRANLRAYLVMNAIMYGLCFAGFGLALIFPELSAWRAATMEGNGSADLVRSLLGNVWLFALVILGVNALTVGVLSIVLPSLIVPFAGLAIFAYRAFTIGMTLAPTSDEMWVAMIPHSLTVVIEFQAYILLVFGAFLLGRSWLRPQTLGAQNRRQGYVRGLQQLGWLSLPALALLIIGAIYEAFSLLYLVGPLVHLLIKS